MVQFSKAHEQAVAYNEVPALGGKGAKSQTQGDEDTACGGHIPRLEALDGGSNEEAGKVEGQTI